MNMNILQDKIQYIIKRFMQLQVPLFLLLLVILYGFVIWRVGSLYSAQPNQTAIASQTSLSLPHIDQTTINEIQQLNDNSVSVQALFNQARQNPFAE